MRLKYCSGENIYYFSRPIYQIGEENRIESRILEDIIYIQKQFEVWRGEEDRYIEIEGNIGEERSGNNLGVMSGAIRRVWPES